MNVRPSSILSGKLMAASLRGFIYWRGFSASVLGPSRAAPSHEAVEKRRICPDPELSPEGRARATATWWGGSALPDFLGRGHHRARLTPTRRQRSSTGQPEQRGDAGGQLFWQKATRKSFSAIQCRRGNFARRAHSVRSGVAVRTKPRRFVIRWTCVSTQMPGSWKGKV